MDKEIAVSHGINWDWFLEYHIPEPGKVGILSHWRIHHGDKMPEATKEYHILEYGTDKLGNRCNCPVPTPQIEGRIAERVVINHDFENPLWVTNPRYIFEYDRPQSSL